MSWSRPVPILIPSVVKNVLSDPAPGFPIFYFPTFIFSPAALVDSAPSGAFCGQAYGEIEA
ncbi:MAG: hypothetical protein WCJ10_08015 [Opitutaceae bacterium]